MNRRANDTEPLFLSRLIAVVLSSVLTSCGGQDGPNTPTTAPAAANRQPSVSLSFSPSGQAVMGATNVTFTAAGSDPDGDSLTYSWNFGDGTMGTGASASKVFNAAGSFSVSVTASDGRGGSGTASQAFTVRTLTGFWRGGQRGLTEALDIDHLSGNRLTGKTTTGITACGGQLNGTVSNPRTVEVSIAFSGACNLGAEGYTGIVDPSLQSMTGTYRIGNTTRTWTFTRD